MFINSIFELVFLIIFCYSILHNRYYIIYIGPDLFFGELLYTLIDVIIQGKDYYEDYLNIKIELYFFFIILF